MNAIWKFHPEYAMGYNAQEQAGLHDMLGLLLLPLGEKIGNAKAGFDFIEF